MATKKKYEDKMHPTDCHYLFNIADEMQFPAARCVQGNSICMYGKSASSGVELMNRANDDICQRTMVDILNAALILLKKESNRYEKAQDQAWNHSQQLTTKGMDLMEEAFKKVNTAMFKIHVTEVEDHHDVIVSKKTTSKREYTVIIPKADIMGSRFGTCTCGYPKKEGIPRNHMVAIS
jgi:hypothetical protein